MKPIQPLLPLLLLLLGLHTQANRNDSTLLIPLAGNTFLSTKDSASRDGLTATGIGRWTSESSVFSIYFWVARSGMVQLDADLELPAGSSRIRVSIAGASRLLNLEPSSHRSMRLGSWKVQGPGYVKVDLQGITRTGPEFARLTTLRASGTAITASATAVKDNDHGMFHFGRRGPSVHLNYELPAAANEVEYFYNEIRVPEGEDVQGSYFMANGFAEGYFGMQVNSPTERRILFSVWSPFVTDNPNEIPEGQRILLLQKGAGVYTGEFGNEGAGGQSYLKFPWKAGATYRFLLRAQPVAKGHTVYSAWFHAPESNQWQLIARFSRPQTQTWLTRLHSFLENFDPATGHLSRKGLYQNQWVRTSQGDWHPVRKARFSGDATARKRYRLDYQGGIEGGAFYLRNCGFFFAPTSFGLLPEPAAAAGAAPPDIPFSRLE